MLNRLLCTWVRVCRIEDNLLKLLLSFSPRGSEKSNSAKAWQPVPLSTEPSCLGTLIFRKSQAPRNHKNNYFKVSWSHRSHTFLSFKAEIWFAYQNHLNTVNFHIFAKFSRTSPVTPCLHYPKTLSFFNSHFSFLYSALVTNYCAPSMGLCALETSYGWNQLLKMSTCMAVFHFHSWCWYGYYSNSGLVFFFFFNN